MRISRMRVASEETNSRSCETKTSVPLNFSSAVLSDSIDSMSRWLVGSSMTSTFGLHQHQLAEDHAALLATGDDATGLFHFVAGKSRRPSVPRISVSILAFGGVGARVFGDPVGQAGVALKSGVVLRVVAERAFSSTLMLPNCGFSSPISSLSRSSCRRRSRRSRPAVAGVQREVRLLKSFLSLPG